MSREVVTPLATAMEETLRPLPEDWTPSDRRPDGSPHGSVYWRDLGGGREITVFLLTFGRARMGLGPLGGCATDEFY